MVDTFKLELGMLRTRTEPELALCLLDFGLPQEPSAAASFSLRPVPTPEAPGAI